MGRLADFLTNILMGGANQKPSLKNRRTVCVAAAHPIFSEGDSRVQLVVRHEDGACRKGLQDVALDVTEIKCLKPLDSVSVVLCPLF